MNSDMYQPDINAIEDVDYLTEAEREAFVQCSQSAIKCVMVRWDSPV